MPTYSQRSIISVLALCNHQFTYKADIVSLISLIPGILVFIEVNALIFIVIPGDKKITLIVFYIPPILANAFLTVLTLVPLCSRAFGYNMCVETVRTGGFWYSRTNYCPVLCSTYLLYWKGKPLQATRQEENTSSQLWNS